MLTENPDTPLILVVEDDDLHACAIQRSFSKSDKEYRLQFVADVQAAQAVLAVHPPDLIISDYKLPDGDGTQLLLAANGVCPIILMTSQGNEQMAVEAMKAGAQDYIVKSAAAFETLPLSAKYALAARGLVIARKKAEDAVRNGKKDWEETFDAVPDLISIIDTNHIITRVNMAMARRCGLAPAEMIGLKCHEVMHGTAEPHERCPHIRMMLDGSRHSEEFIENRMDSVFDITVSPLYDDTGQIRACVHVARDITERKLAEEKKLENDAQYQQTQKLESLGVLAGGIAHDFNNILTIILGHCYIADGGLDSEIDHEDHIQKIKTAANRAADLCRQMLSYAGGNTLVKSKINLWLMVDEAVKMLQSSLKKNIGIELDLKYDVPEFIGDSAQIQQVVMNLIINAGEAIGDKNGTVKVALRKIALSAGHQDTDILGNDIPPGLYACLTVSDDGCGMDEETLKRVFEPFFTTKFTGRGLGMSAVLGIVKSHGGALQLNSTPGVGTLFTVYIPVVEKSGAVDVRQIAEPIAFGKAKGTVLLVEDEEALRNVGSALLKAMGFSPLTASNGREALELYSEHGSGIDLIMLDLIMPVMGGLETYRILRGISPTVPVVICSGHSVEDVLCDMDGDEHASVMQKPYKPGELMNILMKLINKTE